MGQAIERLTAAGRRVFWLVMLALLMCVPVSASDAQGRSPTAVAMSIDGAIGPASAAYLAAGFQKAREQGAQLVLIEMDTPGGLDTSMRQIIQDILAMPMPVVVYVHPSGARAASAGTYIAYAAHIAAMTPGTNLGAATPIQLGGVGGSPDEDKDAKQKQPANAGERKAVNDAVAYIRSLAELRGRNVEWAEEAVRGAASLSARAALEKNVIDLIAPDRASLLRQIDGMVVTIAGKARTIDTTGIKVVDLKPGLGDRVLATITDPNIALILMMVGVYGLLFEFLNPGSMVPGTVGAISLLVGLYALAALPVDLAGGALILLGLALMVGEAFAPSFGILGIGGLIAFVLGAALLIDTDVPAFQVSASVIAALAVAGALVIAVTARLGMRSQRMRVETGEQGMIGLHGEVLDWEGRFGHVLAHGERWVATGPENLERGALVVVEGIRGLQLQVARPS
ncbi:NfeD family protein [Novosphingobium pentaromativorans]|uniref:Uncharacterized protein n=1 Tax=Novosphingobium pentaromativorans US6-1 TaxID=1088721 RepID=G6EGZ9_9SPHN|nr:nodulation protein NfeD [Novosphingobium pentaromativorans]EHJ59288.1 hypothetical protein NSU_3620 [Novosphingobium pentaromativorans US6-1]